MLGKLLRVILNLIIDAFKGYIISFVLSILMLLLTPFIRGGVKAWVFAVLAIIFAWYFWY